MSENPYSQIALNEDLDEETVGVRGQIGSVSDHGAKNNVYSVKKYTDVSEDEGWITVPRGELSENWSDAPSVSLFRYLDRSFVFPGEQLHILACLSKSRQYTEILTPFKVAAVLSKNDLHTENFEDFLKENVDGPKDIPASESSIRIEDHKRETEALLKKFLNSHFFVRIAESDEPLWSRRSPLRIFPKTSEVSDGKGVEHEPRETLKTTHPSVAAIDRGDFNPNVSGGLARTVKCRSLSNGDIAVNICIDILRDPILEIFQVEKFHDRHVSSENQDKFFANQDPCGDLLKWLLPVDNNNTVPPPARPLSPPLLNTASSIGSSSQRPNFSASSGAQLFSFGHFRSYSMSSLPQNIVSQPQPVTTTTSKTSIDLEDLDQFAPQKYMKGLKTGREDLLSFRGVTLEPERFSVCCGLEGIYIPGRRWRKKIEIIQPVEITTFCADCNTDDPLCVQIKNVVPDHAPDVVLYVDAITIIFEEASNGGPSNSLPITCIEAGNSDSLPNLPLRRGEEHSFILKPSSSVWNNLKANNSKSSPFQPENVASTLRLPSNFKATAHYAVLVSCRCNFTESRLFFKKQTSWQPRVSRDLMISVASELSRHCIGQRDGVSQSELPVQVLSLQVSNLTAEDMTLTVLAPTSLMLPPSVVSLNSSPSTTPMTPLIEFTGDARGATTPVIPGENLNQNGNDNGGDDLGCTHLWLQSRVPLGCIPSQSMATIKLELLPLTDGIITLDSLQIYVKEKGVTYIPEHPLKINASRIS